MTTTETQIEPGTDVAPVIQTAAQLYTPMQVALAAWKEEDAAKTFNYDDPEDNKLARSHKFALQKIKVKVDDARKLANEQANKHIAEVNAAAKPLIAEIQTMIDKHQAQIDAAERREAEAAAALDTRVRAIQKVSELDGAATVQQVEDAIKTLADMVVDESFLDRQEEAEKLKLASTMMLDMHLVRARKAEADAAELETLRSEKAKRDMVDTRRNQVQDRVTTITALVHGHPETGWEKATSAQIKYSIDAAENLLIETQHFDDRTLEAESIRTLGLANMRAKLEIQLGAEAQQEADRMAAEQKAEEDRQVAAKAAADKAAADAVEAERKRVADKAAADKAEADRREANTRHRGKIHSAILTAIIDVLAEQDVAGATREEATKAVIAAMAKGHVPHVQINY